MSEQESVSEKELAQFLQSEVFSGKPRSVGEALTAEAPQEPEAPPEAEPPSPEGEPPVVVQDEPPERDLPSEPSPEEEPAPEAEKPAEPEEGDEHVAWAKRKYGDDSAAWAKAAHHQEQQISRLSQQKQESDQLAAQWYEYAQQAEQQAASQTQGMPLSQQEEAWVEQAAMNPLEYARTAAFNGNFALFQGVIGRVAEENPLLAGNISAQVQRELEMASAQQQAQMNGAQAPPLDQALGQTFQRLGLDINEVGPTMLDKISDLGEHHPYVQAMMYGNPQERELAVQAVHDLVRASKTTRKVVRDEERDAALKREGELRREAAGVVTGAPHVPPPAPQSPLLSAMEEEWKQRGQWSEE